MKIIKPNEFENLDFSKLNIFDKFLLVDENEDDIQVSFMSNIYFNCLYEFNYMYISYGLYTNKNKNEVEFNWNEDLEYYLTIDNKNIKLYESESFDASNDLLEKFYILLSECNNQIYYKKFVNVDITQFHLLIPFDNGYLLYITEDMIITDTYYWNTQTSCYLIDKDISDIRYLRENNKHCILNEIKKTNIVKDSKYFDYYMKTVIPLHKITYKNFDKHENKMYELFDHINKRQIRKYFKPIYKNEKYQCEFYLKNILSASPYLLETFYSKFSKDIIDKNIIEKEERKARSVYQFLIGELPINIYNGKLRKNISKLYSTNCELEYKDAGGLIYKTSYYSNRYYVLLDNIYVAASSKEAEEIIARKNLLNELSE